MTAASELSIKKLILVPSVITLAITLLRLVGELQRWSPTLFSREAGGAGALVGIVWLVPVFGILFALKLGKAGQGPAAAGKALGLCILGFALVPIAGVAAAGLGVSQESFTMFGTFVVASIVGGVIAFRAWPALGRVLFAYGLAARIPVVIVMLIAILGSWGTHYDVAPPNLPEMNPFAKWFAIGALPQLTIWIWFTIAVGGIFGSVAALATRGKK
ncbi:MAG: hypothetical protein AB7O37_00965 [Vicinamibacteria bacterium]